MKDVSRTSSYFFFCGFSRTHGYLLNPYFLLKDNEIKSDFINYPWTQLLTIEYKDDYYELFRNI